jgi:hypothetical protein
MTRYLVVIHRHKMGRVLTVAAGDIPRLVATEKANGAVVVGEYSDPRTARRAMLLAIQGLIPRFNSLSDPRFKPKQAS